LRLWDLDSGEQIFERVWPDEVRESCPWGPTHILVYLPNGKAIATGMSDGGVLIWDVSPPKRPEKAGAKTDPETPLERMWSELAGADARQAYRASTMMADSPERALPVLEKRLNAAAEVDPKLLKLLLADLDSDQFTTRDKAAKELAKLGECIVPACEKCWKVNRQRRCCGRSKQSSKRREPVRQAKRSGYYAPFRFWSGSARRRQWLFSKSSPAELPQRGKRVKRRNP
jgi:hypothetical protein